MDMDTIRVTQVQAADKADWLQLWEEWQHHMSGAVPTEVSLRSWQMALDPAHKLVILIARRREGEAVGFATVSFAPFAWTASDVAFLQDLFVSAKARGHGAGEALLKAVYAKADERAASQVFWMVDESDDRLQRFYDRSAIRTPYLRYMRKPWPW